MKRIGIIIILILGSFKSFAYQNYNPDSNTQYLDVVPAIILESHVLLITESDGNTPLTEIDFNFPTIVTSQAQNIAPLTHNFRLYLSNSNGSSLQFYDANTITLGLSQGSKLSNGSNSFPFRLEISKSSGDPSGFMFPSGNLVASQSNPAAVTGKFGIPSSPGYYVELTATASIPNGAITSATPSGLYSATNTLTVTLNLSGPGIVYWVNSGVSTN